MKYSRYDIIKMIDMIDVIRSLLIGLLIGVIIVTGKILLVTQKSEIVDRSRAYCPEKS